LQNALAVPTDIEKLFGQITEKFDNVGKGRMSQVTSMLFTLIALSYSFNSRKNQSFKHRESDILLIGTYSFLLLMGYFMVCRFYMAVNSFQYPYPHRLFRTSQFSINRYVQNKFYY
jgi:hypothetical protein